MAKTTGGGCHCPSCVWGPNSHPGKKVKPCEKCNDDLCYWPRPRAEGQDAIDKSQGFSKKSLEEKGLW